MAHSRMMTHFNLEYSSCPHPLSSTCFLSWFAGPRTFAALLTRAKAVPSSWSRKSLRQKKALEGGVHVKAYVRYVSGSM